MRKNTRRAREQGFNLIELIVLMAIIGIISLLGFPALQNMIYRSKVEGSIRTAASQVRAARLDAVKRYKMVFVEADYTNHRFATWLDDGDESFDNTKDTLLSAFALPEAVEFWGPADAAPEGPDAVNGLAVGEPYTFKKDGAAEVAGGVRLGDAKGNFFEIRVDPPATGRVSLRKFDGTGWYVQGENGKNWVWNY